MKIDYSSLQGFDLDNRFICMLVRMRDHCSYRSSELDYLKQLMYNFCNQGYFVYVGGKCADDFCNDQPNCKYVSRLQDWASLMHHHNCSFITGPTSGASAVLGQLCCRSKILVFDPSGISRIGCFAKHPLYFGKCVNFTNVPYKFYTYKPTFYEILNDVSILKCRLGQE
jgi:hypothetical protein